MDLEIDRCWLACIITSQVKKKNMSAFVNIVNEKMNCRYSSFT